MTVKKKTFEVKLDEYLGQYFNESWKLFVEEKNVGYWIEIEWITERIKFN